MSESTVDAADHTKDKTSSNTITDSSALFETTNAENTKGSNTCNELSDNRLRPFCDKFISNKNICVDNGVLEANLSGIEESGQIALQRIKKIDNFASSDSGGIESNTCATVLMRNEALQVGELPQANQLEESLDAVDLNEYSPPIISFTVGLLDESLENNQTEVSLCIPVLEKMAESKMSNKNDDQSKMTNGLEDRGTIVCSIAVNDDVALSEVDSVPSKLIQNDITSRIEEKSTLNVINCNQENGLQKTNSVDVDMQIKIYSNVTVQSCSTDLQKILVAHDCSSTHNASDDEGKMSYKRNGDVDGISTGSGAKSLSGLSADSRKETRSHECRSALSVNTSVSSELPAFNNVTDLQTVKNSDLSPVIVSEHQTMEHHRSSKTKSKSTPDNMRPVGRILHDLGLDLVRQEVYKDLIDIQAAKNSEDRLDDKDKGQLLKLTEAYGKLKLRNHPYVLSRIRCGRCRYVSTTRNVLELHREHGHCSRAGVHTCCVCDSFRSRYASQFIGHMETVHSMNGRLTKKASTTVCSYCPYEHKNSFKVDDHTAKCVKKFQLAVNLQPQPSDCDIPLRLKQPLATWNRPPGASNPYEVGPPQAALSTTRTAVPFSATNAGVVHPQSGARGGGTVMTQPSVMEIGGQLYSWGNHNGKPLLTSLRSQIGSNGAPVSTNNSRNYNVSVPTGGALFKTSPLANIGMHQLIAQQQELSRSRAALASPTPAHAHRRETCEICGANVDNRQALWAHLQSAHKVQLSRAGMSEREPIACEMCKARFWTYQGLARHSLLLHKRSSDLIPPSRGSGAGANAQQRAFKCHLCGTTQSSNPLNHLSTHHNVTLLDMYHGRQCCMCNVKLRTGRAFEDHMIHDHRDIFANLDVLHTVLQALSTALGLKSRDVRPSSSQQQQQQRQQQMSVQQRQQQTMVAAASAAAAQMKPGSRNAVGLNNHNRSTSNDVRFRSPSAVAALTPQKRKQSTIPSPAVKTAVPEKVDTEEEKKALNKLYEDYADIGRPISRSMKQKLLSSPAEEGRNARRSSELKSIDVGLDLSCPKESKNSNAEAVSAKAVESEGTPCAKKSRRDSGEPVSKEGEIVPAEDSLPSTSHSTVDKVA